MAHFTATVTTKSAPLILLINSLPIPCSLYFINLMTHLIIIYYYHKNYSLITILSASLLFKSHLDHF